LGIQKQVALKADVQIERHPDGREDEVAFHILSRDGKALTGNQIVEAVAEAVLLYWDNCPIEERDELEFDA
jgi:hypothetical protein